MMVLQICNFRHLLLHPVEIRGVFGDDAVDVTHNNIAETVGKQQFCDGYACRSGSVYNNFTGFLLLFNNFQGIDDTSKHNDGRSMLVIVEDRDIKKFF